jgi:hypothetical protein
MLERGIMSRFQLKAQSSLMGRLKLKHLAMAQ